MGISAFGLIWFIAVVIIFGRKQIIFDMKNQEVYATHAYCCSYIQKQRKLGPFEHCHRPAVLSTKQFRNKEATNGYSYTYKLQVMHQDIERWDRLNCENRQQFVSELNEWWTKYKQNKFDNAYKENIIEIRR
eukprot:256440_1